MHHSAHSTNFSASEALSALPRIIISACAVFAFILVLFADLLPLPFGGYADQRLALLIICGLLVTVPVFVFFIKPQIALRQTLVMLLPMLILCLAFLVLSVPFYEQNYVWVEPGMYAFYFLAISVSGSFLAWSDKSVVYARLLIMVSATTCLVYGLASFNVYLFATFDGMKNLIDFIPWSFVNIRYWSHIATWCLPLLPLAVMIGPLKAIRSWRLAMLLGGGLWWWILFISAGRGSALGVTFGVIMAVALFGRRALPWFKIFVFYIGAGFVLWLLLSVLIPAILSDGDIYIRKIHAGDSGRLPLFIEAWHMSLQNFPFGMGPQAWLTHDVLTEGYSASRKFGHPHNMYLLWAAEYGWILMVAIGMVVGQAIRHFWKVRRALLVVSPAESSDEKLLILAAFTSSVSGALFHAGVSAVLMAPGSMLIGLFVLIAFWALIMPTQADLSSHSQRPKPRPVFGLIICVFLFLSWLVWTQGVWDYYQDMLKDEEPYYEEMGRRASPRFWLHGNFPR